MPPSPGLFPYRDIEKASLLAGAPPMVHLRSVLSVSHTPNGLLLARSCKSISSCSHVWDSLFRGYLPATLSDSTHRRAVPSCHYANISSSQVAPTVQIRKPCLQGIELGGDPLRPTGGLDLPITRSPLEFSLLRAFLRPPWRRLHVPSAHDLRCQTLKWPWQLAYSVSISNRPEILSPESLPVRDSRTTFPSCRSA
jgi:hypothetical protein